MDLCKIKVGVDPAFVNFWIFCKAKRDVTEANRDVTESSDCDFKTFYTIIYHNSNNFQFPHLSKTFQNSYGP